MGDVSPKNDHALAVYFMAWRINLLASPAPLIGHLMRPRDLFLDFPRLTLVSAARPPTPPASMRSLAYLKSASPMRHHPRDYASRVFQGGAEWEMFHLKMITHWRSISWEITPLRGYLVGMVANPTAVSMIIAAMNRCRPGSLAEA